MKIQNQCCLLDQAKKLNELGIVQGCSMLYFDTTISNDVPLFNRSYEGYDEFYNAMSCFSAFTVAELGVMLGDDHLPFCPKYENKTEAECRAYTLIEHIQLGDIKVHVINERLKNS